jgi:hypothetical protein
MPEQKKQDPRMVAYASVYLDRGESLSKGRSAISTQLGAIRKQASEQGGSISVVAIDVIVRPGTSQRKLEEVTAEAERLAHEAFADHNDPELPFYVVALKAETREEDPRDHPQSARSLAIASVGGSEAS